VKILGTSTCDMHRRGGTPATRWTIPAPAHRLASLGPAGGGM